MDSPLIFQEFIVFLAFLQSLVKDFSTRNCTSKVMKMPKNFTHFCHSTPNGVFTRLLKDQIHIASVFSTFSFKPDTFSKSSGKLKKALAEFKSDKTAVVSSANCFSLVSVPLISTPLMFFPALTAMAKISTAIKKGMEKAVSLSYCSFNGKLICNCLFVGWLVCLFVFLRDGFRDDLKTG